MGATPGGTHALPSLARILRLANGKLDEARVKAFVLALEDCLPKLPARLRSLLELRSGVGEAHPLSPKAVAIRLGVPARRLDPLELAALEVLQRTAARTACAASSSAQGPGVIFASYGSAGAPTPKGSFGLESARAEKAPGTSLGAGAAKSSPPSASASSLLGLRPGSSAFWTLAAVLLVLTVLVTAILDNLGIGPRHRYRGGVNRRK